MPNLNNFMEYFQGYHDVAITLLLVCKEKAAFPLLCRLSYGELAPLAPFMQVTMEPTQHCLNYLHPLIRLKNEQLADFLRKYATCFQIQFLYEKIVTEYDLQIDSRNNVCFTLVFDMVRSQPQSVHGRGEVVRLFLMLSTNVSDIRHRCNRFV